MVHYSGDWWQAEEDLVAGHVQRLVGSRWCRCAAASASHQHIPQMLDLTVGAEHAVWLLDS